MSLYISQNEKCTPKLKVQIRMETQIQNHNAGLNVKCVSVSAYVGTAIESDNQCSQAHRNVMFIDVLSNCSCCVHLMNGPSCNVIFVQSKSAHSLMWA